jgi:hypothetical protein
MNKAHIQLILLLSFSISMVSCKKETSEIENRVRTYESLIHYTNHYDNHGQLVNVEIEETEFSFNKKTNSTHKTKRYIYKDNKLAKIETYVNNLTDTILLDISNIEDFYTERIEFAFNGDTLLYEKKINDYKNRNIEWSIKSFQESESGLDLKEYSISRSQYDDMSGRETNSVYIDLKEGKTIYYENKYEQLADTFIRTILQDKSVNHIIKTYIDKKENTKHELTFDENCTLISQNTSWMKGENVYLETSSRKYGEGTYMSDSTFYENGKIIKVIMVDPPLVFQDSYKYDKQGNITERINVIYEKQKRY